MANWLAFLVFIFFAVSSTNADTKPNADAKRSQLTSPDRESNVNTVVVGNQMIRAHDGVEKDVEEERGAQEAIDDLVIALKKFWKESGASQAVKDVNPRNWWRTQRRESLLKRGADYRTLFKSSVSVKDVEQSGRPETAKLYGQFLQEKKSTLDNLIDSSEKKHWLHKILVKWNFPYRVLLKARVNANTVKDEGRMKQFEAYKKYLKRQLEKVNRLMQ